MLHFLKYKILTDGWWMEVLMDTGRMDRQTDEWKNREMKGWIMYITECFDFK